MPKPDEQQQAKLKIGKKLVYVQVLDESAGGFLVSANRIPKTQPMESVELFHTSGAHCLRVAWRRNFDGRTRLGLQRMVQTPPKQESPWLIWLVAAVVIGQVTSRLVRSHQLFETLDSVRLKGPLGEFGQ